MSVPNEDLFQTIKADFLRAMEAGESLGRDELLRQYPEFAEQLNALFVDADRTPLITQTDAGLMPSEFAAVDQYATIPSDALDERSELMVPAAGAIDFTTTRARQAVEKIRYFGDYELQEEIARGGMGVVYKACQVNLNRLVALKMILAGQFASIEDVKRFYTEAEAAATLDHPGIVPIFEIGQHEGQHFFSMAFIEGNSLADRVKNGPLPPKEAAEITMKLAEAIAYAHENGVIHRDLKPANVLLDRHGEPKVTDFGLAKKVTGDSGLTQTGAVMGTPSYMPPEQAAGKTSEVGPLSDVYSLGAILYCLLTGRPPFQSSNVLETLKQVVEVDPVSPKLLNPEIDSDLETLCLKCLEKDSHQRLRSAQFLAEELERYLNGFPIRSRRSGYSERLQKWCLRNRAEAALIVTIVLAVLLGSSLLAVAGLSKIEKQFGTDTVSLALFVLCLFGPVISVARLLGLRGVRTFELTLMRIWKNCICSIYAAATGFILFVGLALVGIALRALWELADQPVPFVLLLLLYLSVATWVQRKYQLRPGASWMWGLMGLGFTLYILPAAPGKESPLEIPAAISFVGGFFIAVWAFNYGFGRLIYGSAQRYAKAVKQMYGWVPWPFTMARGPFRMGRFLYMQNFVPFALLIGVIQLLLTVAMLFVVLPMWLVEQLRLILLPNSPIVTESLCYLISFGAFATLVASLLL